MEGRGENFFPFCIFKPFALISIIILVIVLLLIQGHPGVLFGPRQGPLMTFINDPTKKSTKEDNFRVPPQGVVKDFSGVFNLLNKF